MNRRSLLLGAIGAVCFSTSLAHAAAVEDKQYVRLETCQATLVLTPLTTPELTPSS